MLNEIAEFEQYTDSPNSCTRLSSLKGSAKKSEYNGIERALLTVARGSAFDSEGNFSAEDGLAGLNEWCGFSGEDSFLKKFLGNETWNNTIACNSKKEQLNAKMSSSGSYDNSFKMITFERILADAFEAGPLKRYYLVCKKAFYENCVFYNGSGKKKDSKKLEYSNAGGKNQHNNSANSVLKLTACYLLSKPEDSDWAYVNQTSLVNWGSADRATLAKLLFNGETIYNKLHINEQVILVKLPEDWIDNFFIAEENDLDNYPENEYVFWSDTGGGNKDNYLRFCEKYEVECFA